jgi:hypothetical protein
MVDSVEAQRPDVTAVDLNARTNGKSFMATDVIPILSSKSRISLSDWRFDVSAGQQKPGNRALRRAAARQSKKKGNIK